MDFFQISCGCQGDCSTSRCSCKKAGIPCTRMCKYCNGNSCHNASKIDIIDDGSDSESIEENALESDDFDGEKEEGELTDSSHSQEYDNSDDEDQEPD